MSKLMGSYSSDFFIYDFDVGSYECIQMNLKTQSFQLKS